jgi:hypothetical protein
MTLPEDASTGLAPQRAAKADSERIRCGLSPALTNRGGGHLRADATSGQQRRVGLGAEPGEVLIEVVDLAAEIEMAPGQGPQCRLGRLARGRDIAGPEPGTGGHAPLSAAPSQLGSELVRGVDEQISDLVGGLGAGLDGRAPGQAQHTDGLHRPVPGLGCPRRLTVERGSGGGLGVGGVGLAPPATQLAVGSVDLDHLHLRPGQVTSEPGSVAARAFNADPGQPAVAVSHASSWR